MAAGQYRTAQGLHHWRKPEMGQHADRFHYVDDRVFEKPFDWQIARRMGAFAAPYLRLMIMAAIAMFVATAARLAVPYLIAQAIDVVLREEPVPAFWNRWLLAYEPVVRLNVLVGIMAAVHMTGWVANFFRVRLTHLVGQGVLHDMRHKLFSHVQTLSFKFFDSRPAGSILVRITNDINSLQDLFTNGIINLLQDVLQLAGIILIMLTMHTKLALVILALLPFAIVVTGRLRMRIRRGWQLVRVKQSRMTAHLAEAIQGVRVTQSFHQEEENKSFFFDLNADNRWVWLRVLRKNALFRPIVEIMAALGTLIIYWYGALLVGREEITLGVFLAFATYLNQFWQPIERLTQLYGQILVAMASSERICEYLDTQPTVQERPGAVELPTVRGKVELQDVHFAYEEGRPALRGVSLTVEPGEMVALVGHTGAGKTSIINLLSRFYDVNRGAIRIDGHDVRDVTLDSLRRQIAIVLQDTFIFQGTIMENIRFGRLDATDEEVVAAAKAVRAHDFIVRLPEGYHTQVRERGSRLSMGERQLISFARALLADPRILVLDEATASIDTQTERLIQEALGRLLKGRTSFVIAHRLSTIRSADKIVVLDHGRVVEMGDHEALMRQRGVYYNLIQAQFRFFESA